MKSNKKPCCDLFVKASGQFNGMAFLNPSLPEAQIQKNDKGKWNINGCCGGCYVVQDIKHCPFCGEKLP